MQKEVSGDHVPSFLFFANPAIQNPNIQKGVFLAKMNSHQSMSFFIYCHQLSGYIAWFVVSKSLCIEDS